MSCFTNYVKPNVNLKATHCVPMMILLPLTSLGTINWKFGTCPYQCRLLRRPNVSIGTSPTKSWEWEVPGHHPMVSLPFPTHSSVWSFLHAPPHLIAKIWNVRPEVRPTIGFGAKLPQQTLMSSTCRVYYPFGAFFIMLESNHTLITKII